MEIFASDGDHGVTSRHVQLLRVPQKMARRGVVQLTWAKTVRWAILLGADLVKGAEDSDSRFVRTRGWDAVGFGTLETLLACEYK